MKQQTRAYALATLAILFWSTAASAFKLTLAHQHFSIVLFVASITAAAVMLIISIRTGRARALLQPQPLSLLLGFFNPFLYYFVLFQAYNRLPAQLAQPLNFLWPLMIVLFSIPLLNQKVHLRDGISLLISFIGVFIISTRGSLTELHQTDPVGVILALSSSVVLGLYFVLNVRSTAPVTVTLFHSFVCGACIIGLYILLAGCSQPITTAGLLGSVYIGIFEMGITFYLWISALKLTSSTARLSNFIYLTPFLSLIFIAAVLGEHIYPTTVLGLLMIVGAIVFQKRGNTHD